MSSSTSSRYRESAAVTAPTKVHDQTNTSFAEEHALDAIAKEVCIRLVFFNQFIFIYLLFTSRPNFVYNINVNKIVKHVNYDIKN